MREPCLPMIVEKGALSSLENTLICLIGIPLSYLIFTRKQGIILR